MVKKQGKKGQEITYSELKMAEYLMPNLENISIEDRRTIFEIRNRMLPIAVNFPSKTSEKSCWCGKDEDTRHIYICRYWTDESEKTPFELIYKEISQN